MKPLRIALFTGNYNHIADGVSLTLNRLAEHLISKGHTVRVYAPTIPNPPIKHHGTLVELPSIPMPGRPEYRITIGFPATALKDVTEYKPDLVHIATPDIAGVAAVLFALERGIPVVSSFHTHFTSYMHYYKLGWTVPLIWMLYKWVYKRSAVLYVPSESMADLLKDHGINTTIEIWARGVDTGLFSPAKRSFEWRRSLGIEDHQKVVLFVSRLVWEKELDTVLAIFKNVASDSIKTVIVGDGPAGRKLRNQLPDTLFLGYLKGEALAMAYASSDMFIFPSVTETFGNVTLEALSSGLPSIVADATGNKSLVLHGKTGYIVPPKSVEEFSRCITYLSVNETFRSEMSHRARAFASSFTWEQILENLVESYYQVVRK